MIDLDTVLAKCDHLVEVGLWPREQDLPYRRWLSNFESHQKLAAAKVLDRLIYVNEDMALLALKSACQRLLRSFAARGNGGRLASTKALASVHASIIITPIRGEQPSPADSAYSYTRAARDRLGFQENQIVDDIVTAVDRASKSNGIVVLVDDIIGSGEQLINTIRRSEHTQAPSCTLACLAAIVTSNAHKRLATAVPALRIFPGHILDVKRYGINSLLPATDHPDTHDLLNRFGTSLQVPANTNPVYGYNDLGLTLAFHNCIPDFSLPILWAKAGQDWTPLKERH